MQEIEGKGWKRCLDSDGGQEGDKIERFLDEEEVVVVQLHYHRDDPKLAFTASYFQPN